jgi:N-acetyl-anhydromuramoyl-L-alanine amidase
LFLFLPEPDHTMTLQVHVPTGLLTGVRQVLSPHFDSRPPAVATDLIVVHGISLPPGEYGGPWIDRLFTGQLPPQHHPYFATIEGARVSAHLLIRRDGEIVQFVPFHERAWHAGVSTFKGRTACNDFSIGIEMEGADDEAYTSEQYVAAASAIRALIAAYPVMGAQQVLGHSDIAPGRKTDPGPAFDWDHFRRLLQVTDS